VRFGSDEGPALLDNISTISQGGASPIKARPLNKDIR
jgi:hypothetical protein